MSVADWQIFQGKTPMKLCYPTPNPSPQKGGEGRLKPHHRGAREKTPILLNSLEIKTLRSQGVKGEGKLSSSIPQGEVRSVAAYRLLFGRICNPAVLSLGICNPPAYSITNAFLNSVGFQIRQNRMLLHVLHVLRRNIFTFLLFHFFFKWHLGGRFFALF